MFDNIERESLAFLAKSSCVMLNFFLASIKFGRGFSSFILLFLLAHLVNFIFVLYAHGLNKSSIFCLFYERLFYEHFILKYNQKVSVIKMFKERLKSLRLGRGITQEQLADKLNVPHSTIRRYESMDSGYPKEERLQVIADFFSCTVDYLLGREVKEKSTAEKLIDYLEMELSNDEIKERMTFKVDDITLSSEEVDEFVDFVRVQRLMKKQRSAVSSKYEGP